MRQVYVACALNRTAAGNAGVTYYRAANEAPSEGRWVVREDRFCSQWPSAPAWVCYDMLRDGDVVVFISENDEEWTARIAGGS